MKEYRSKTCLAAATPRLPVRCEAHAANGARVPVHIDRRLFFRLLIPGHSERSAYPLLETLAVCHAAVRVPGHQLFQALDKTHIQFINQFELPYRIPVKVACFFYSISRIAAAHVFVEDGAALLKGTGLSQPERPFFSRNL